MLIKQKWTNSLLLFIIIALILPYFIITPVMAAEENISIDMRNADVRDILSAIAVNLDKNIIFTGQTSRVSVNIQDVDPNTALEYVLNIMSFEYIEDDNYLIVGHGDALSNDFYNNISLTKFTLKYLKAHVISEQIDILGIPVKKLVLESNPNIIWIQGLPREINKIKEIISKLDSAENFPVQSGEVALLTPVEMNYISAEQMNTIISQMGIQPGIVLENNPNTLWVFGDSFLISQIESIKNNVDVAENSSTDSFLITPVKLTYLTTNEIEHVLNQLNIDINILTFDKTLKTVWLNGNSKNTRIATDIIKKFDVKDHSSDSSFFVYNTINITADELRNRIQQLNLPNVEINYLNYPGFSKSVIIYCPTDFRLFVMSHINNLDVETEKIKLPIDYSSVSGGRTYLKNRLNLLVKLTGIPSTSFTITDSVSRDGEYHYIMYLEESPENIKLVKDYIGYIDNPLSN